MPGRCGCASDRCSCFIQEGEGIKVTGAGTEANPYVVTAENIFVEGGGPETPTPGSRIVGEMVEYGGTTAPAGWLLCNGQAVSRAVYSDLFAVISTRFGAGDGVTTFNLPNRADKVAVGVSGSKALGSTGGSDSVNLTVAQLPGHTHPIDHDHGRTTDNGSHDHPLARSANPGGSASTIPYGTTTQAGTASRTGIVADGVHDHDVPAYTGASGSTGSGSPVSVVQQYVALNYLIKT